MRKNSNSEFKSCNSVHILRFWFFLAELQLQEPFSSNDSRCVKESWSQEGFGV